MPIWKWWVRRKTGNRRSPWSKNFVRQWHWIVKSGFQKIMSVVIFKLRKNKIFFLFQKIQRCIAGNRKQPRSEASPAFVCAGFFPDFDESFLRNILGVVLRFDHSPNKIVNQVQIVFYQNWQSALVPVQIFFHQLFVVFVHFRAIIARYSSISLEFQNIVDTKLFQDISQELRKLKRYSVYNFLERRE